MDLSEIKLGDYIKVEQGLDLPSRYRENIGVVSGMILPNRLFIITDERNEDNNYEDYKELNTSSTRIPLTKYTKEEFQLIIAEKLKGCHELLGDYKEALREIFPYRCVFTEHNRRVAAYILFPEIDIETDYKMSIKVKNFVFRIDFNTNGTIHQIYSSRYKATKKEIMAKYGHSHSGKSCLFGFTSDVCFGSTELSRVYDDLRLNKNLDNFELLSYQLINYLKYESTEGGPHVTVDSIFNRNDVNEILFTQRDWIKRLKDINYEPDIDLSQYGDDFEFNVNENHLSEFMLKDPIISNLLRDSDLIGRMIEGNYSIGNDIDSENNIDLFKNSPSLDVSDEVNSINLIREVDEIDLSQLGLEENEYVHQPLLKSICKEYSKNLRKYLINEQIYA